MCDLHPEALFVHHSFLRADRDCKRSEARLVAALLDVDRERVWKSLGYASIYDYARHEVGWAREKTAAMLRLGRALRGLPVLRAAFEAGEIDRSKLREVVRVASPDTE